MGKRLLISEDEKLIIRSLHNTLKEKENYFQIQENKIKSIIMEQTGELPSLRQGETRDEGGKMVTNKTENIALLIARSSGDACFNSHEFSLILSETF